MHAAFAWTMLALLLALGLVGPAGAQGEERLEDPSCEEDPMQAGCDPACAADEVDCDHPPCPTDLVAATLANGENFMTWTLNSFSDVKVYRAEGDGPFELTDHLDFPATRHLDQEVEPGVTYRYQVRAFGLHQYNESMPAVGESPACETAEVSTIPVFPHVVAGALAAVLGLVAYVAVRRRP